MTRPPYRICVVCSGNICRSPIAEEVLRARLTGAGLGANVLVDSAGTGGWHVGDGADRRALSALRKAGYDGTAHRARAFEVEWLTGHDLVLAADRGHLRALLGWAREAGRESAPAARVASGRRADIRLLREFDPRAAAAGTLELADPYYGDAADFARCVRQVEDAVPGIIEYVRAALGR